MAEAADGAGSDRSGGWGLGAVVAVGSLGFGKSKTKKVVCHQEHGMGRDVAQCCTTARHAPIPLPTSTSEQLNIA